MTQTPGSIAAPPRHDYERIPYLVAYQNTSAVRDVYGGVAADNAIEAGVDSIEHGFFLTDAQLQQSAAQQKLAQATATSAASVASAPRSRCAPSRHSSPRS